MTVIVAHDTPDAIRGMLKRWFIEPRPNVFVGTLNRRTHEKTIEYIKRNAADIGLLIISSYPKLPGLQNRNHRPNRPQGHRGQRPVDGRREMGGGNTDWPSSKQPIFP